MVSPVFRMRRRLPAPERRRQLLQTAVQILDTEGSDALSLPRLALAAGVTKPVAYEHFGTRAALLTAAMQEFSEDLFARVSRAVARYPDDISGAVRAANEAYLEYITERGRGLRNLFASVSADPVIEEVRLAARDRHVDLWVGELDRLTARPRNEKRAIAAMFVGSMEILGGHVIAGLLSRRAASQLQVDAVLRFLDREAPTRARPRARGGRVTPSAAASKGRGRSRRAVRRANGRARGRRARRRA